MSSFQSPQSQIEQAIQSSNFALALRLGDKLLAQSKRNLLGWVTRARCNLMLGNLCDADRELDQALRLAPGDPQASLLRGMVDQRIGRIDRAVEVLGLLARSTSPYATEARVTLAETLYFANRREEFRKFVADSGEWGGDPRSALFRARVSAATNPAQAIEALLRMVDSANGIVLRRVAGFDAVGLLDRTGRYREALDLAQRMHRETTPPFDLGGMLSEITQQLSLLKRGALGKAKVPKVEGVAMVLGVPRSGTTLLEQMLDSHPAISGIGEYDGAQRIAQGIISLGVGLGDISRVSPDDLMILQSSYLAGASQLKRPGAQWAFDKNLKAWRWLPAVAAVLPGAVFFHVARDPRDTAISTLFSFFHPNADGWTASLESLYEVIAAERAILPRALDDMEIRHEKIVYEKLVADPRGHSGRCLARLGLEMVDSVAQPEKNPRAVFTLSHEQVRRPINTASIGRWRNYEWAFDSRWDELSRLHEARMGELPST